MQEIKIRTTKGLDLNLFGKPQNKIYDAIYINDVAVLGNDYVGIKPKILVEEGDSIQIGTPLFYDKNNEKVGFTAPASGKIKAINRGDKRALESIVITIDDEKDNKRFESFSFLPNRTPTKEVIINNLLLSGSWTSFRERPFGRIPNPETKPQAIFVNAMDSNPLAPDVALIINEHKDEFTAGIKVLSILTDSNIYVCYKANDEIPKIDIKNVVYASFRGRHPYGLVGTHIHFLSPVSLHKTIWYLSASDVVAFGRLFLTGKILTTKIISLAGSMVKKPRLLEVRNGADLKQLTDFELKDGDKRIISGSPLSGHIAKDNSAYLGRYHQQVTVIPEGEKEVDSTLLNGRYKSIVPFAVYDNVNPLNILSMPLLKSLAVLDTETAQTLGCLELEEEDVALFSYVCPSKNNYGKLLRATLNEIIKEG